MSNEASTKFETALDPHRLARRFLKKNATDASGKFLLRYWREEWWSWDEGRYRKVTERELSVQLTRFIKGLIDDEQILHGRMLASVTKGMVSNALQAIAAEVLVSSFVEQPAWIGPTQAHTNFVSLQNGLVDIEKAAGGDANAFRPHTPEWFSVVQFPYAYDSTATCPRWASFLEEVLESDEERIHLLQEWSGYLLTPDTSLQKFLVLEGEGANGKSVVLDTLGNLLGEANVSHVPIDKLGDRFQNTMTVNRLANIAPEVNETAQLNEGMLKQFIGGDRMYCDRKGLPGTEVRPTARLIVATNNRPAITDRSQGMFRRMLYIPFRISIPAERQDRHLVAKLRDELPGIFNWALVGRRRLSERGLFTEPQLSREALAEYRAESNPAGTFLRERCVADGSAQVTTELLYQAYVAFAKSSGFTPLTAPQFGKEVKKVFPQMRKSRSTSEVGSRPWVYSGIALADSMNSELPSAA